MEFKSVVEYMKHYLVLLCFVNYKIRKKLSAYGLMIPTYIFIHELYAWNNIWSDLKNRGSVLVSGQPRSNHGNRPWYPYGPPLLINLSMSCLICHNRARKGSSTLSADRARGRTNLRSQLELSCNWARWARGAVHFRGDPDIAMRARSFYIEHDWIRAWTCFHRVVIERERGTGAEV